MSLELGRPDEPSKRPPEGASLVTYFTPRLILGLGVIGFGVLLLLDNLDLVEASRMLRYLVPCVLLGIGATVLAKKSASGWLWILAGGWTLLGALDIIDAGFWEFFFPLALVSAGYILVSRSFRAPRPKPDGLSDRDGIANAFAFMSGNERKNDSSTFRGGDLFAFMGGVTLDLRRAKALPEGAMIDAFTMWGGIEIRVPENWRVVSEVVPLLGGFEDNTKPPADPSAIEGRLLVRGVAFMGGIEVKN